MNDYLDNNRRLWNGWTALHRDSSFYDLDGFRAGALSLRGLEREELGDVAGKSLLHLQCHFGMDTLSWARLGASVTGVDFSDDAIATATALADELCIPARFIHANVYDVPGRLAEQFDIVFTSYGALPWLPDLNRWAGVVAHALKPGGTFYIVEFHPFLNLLDDNAERLTGSYFHRSEPGHYNVQGSYAAPDSSFTHGAYEWNHTLADVVSALIGTGLRIEFLHEFPFSTYGCYSWLEAAAPERWHLRGNPDTIPLMFSIKATKDS